MNQKRSRQLRKLASETKTPVKILKTLYRIPIGKKRIIGYIKKLGAR